MTNYVKHPDAEYVMPFLFNIGFFIPALKELLKDEVNPIKYVYGTLRSQWSGGRPSPMTISNINQIDKYIERITNMGLVPTFTFTNLSLTKDSLKDEFCNQLLDIGYKYKCHFIIASDLLYKHIKSRYNDAKTVCSVIVPSIKFKNLFFDETKFYNEMLDKHDTVVVRPEWTLENLNNISKLVNDCSRIEILINQTCAYNCPNVKRHYKLIDKLEHNKISEEDMMKEWKNFCPNEKNINQNRSLFIDDKKIDVLLAQGIKKIKIQGRTYPLNIMMQHLFTHFFSSKIPQEQIRRELQKIYENSQKIAQNE